MNIVCVYVLPTAPHYLNDGSRFVASYNLYPAGAEHRLIIVSNGGAPSFEAECLLSTLSHDYEVFCHDGCGWDISAFQIAAKTYPCDCMVFFGTTAYLRGPNWLKRMAQAFETRGAGALYGSTANCGDPRFGVWPHIRTTGFFMSPALMNMHPLRVTDPSQRYPFEHGPNCLSEWCKNQGYKRYMVTWDGEYELEYADGIANGFHRGTQEALLVGDRLTAPPYYSVP